MRLVVFLFLFIGTGTIKLRRVNGKPVGIYEEISLSDEVVEVKKREDSSRLYLEQCGIVEFPNARRGVVNVLAFLDSSWPYSHRQAIMLEMLSSRLRKSGLTEILFFVVNVSPYFPRKIDTTEDDIEREAWLGVSPDEIEGFARINETLDSFARIMNADIELIQDNEELGIWKLLGGSRDQVLVIDRCGKLTYQVIVPWSILHFPYVKAAILSTYNDQPCEECNLNEQSPLEEALQSTSWKESVADTVTVENSPKTESSFAENFMSTSDSRRTETTTSTPIFFSYTDTAIDAESTTHNLINGNTNANTKQLVTENPDETTTESFVIGFQHEISTLVTGDDVTTIFPEVNTSGRSDQPLQTPSSTFNYESTIFGEKGQNSGTWTTEARERTTQETSDHSATEITTDFPDSDSRIDNYGSTNINKATSPGTTIDNFENTTPDVFVEMTEVPGFQGDSATKIADSTLDLAFDSINSEVEVTNLSTADNYEATEAGEDDKVVVTTMGELLESTTPEISSLEEKYERIDDLSAKPEILEENEAKGIDAAYVPIRIIMHAPHFHVDSDSTRMHEYLVMKTGSSNTHGHLASHDATRLYNGPQDHQEVEMSDSAAEEVEKKAWPVKNLIFTKDESTGLFGEVADYWRDLSSLENYDEPEETERPDNPQIYEEGPTSEKFWGESSASRNENSETGAESLAAEAASEIMTEVQPMTRPEEFDSDEDETRNKLIAHYSKLLPWIYYVLDK